MTKEVSQLTLPHGDINYDFEIVVEDGLVTTSHPTLGSKTTQVGGSPWDSIGTQLARELIRDNLKQ